MKRTSSRTSRNQDEYLRYVANNPGCIIADVDRACRQNPQAGHKWVYDGVQRLVKRGYLRSERVAGKVHLYPVGKLANSANI